MEKRFLVFFEIVVSKVHAWYSLENGNFKKKKENAKNVGIYVYRVSKVRTKVALKNSSK